MDLTAQVSRATSASKSKVTQFGRVPDFETGEEPKTKGWQKQIEVMSDLKEASREGGNSISLSPQRSHQVQEQDIPSGKMQNLKKSTIGGASKMARKLGKNPGDKMESYITPKKMSTIGSPTEKPRKKPQAIINPDYDQRGNQQLKTSTIGKQSHSNKNAGAGKINLFSEQQKGGKTARNGGLEQKNTLGSGSKEPSNASPALSSMQSTSLMKASSQKEAQAAPGGARVVNKSIKKKL